MTFTPEHKDSPRLLKQPGEMTQGEVTSVDTETLPQVATKSTYADSLRALADLADAHPERFSGQSHRHLVYCRTRKDLTEVIRDFGGRWKKDTPTDEDNYFGATLDLGSGLTVYAYTVRENVCEQVQVGTRTVLVPADDAPMVERVVLEPAPDAPMVEKVEPIMRWHCPGSLLSGDTF